MFDGSKRVDCVGGALDYDQATQREACAPCFMHAHVAPALNSTHNATAALAPYWFTVDITSIKRVDAWCNVGTTVLVVFVLIGCVVIFRRDASHLSNSLATPIKALAKDMEHVSQMAFNNGGAQDLSHLYEISKIQKSFSLMKGILQVRARVYHLVVSLDLLEVLSVAVTHTPHITCLSTSSLSPSLYPARWCVTW